MTTSKMTIDKRKAYKHVQKLIPVNLQFLVIENYPRHSVITVFSDKFQPMNRKFIKKTKSLLSTWQLQ